MKKTRLLTSFKNNGIHRNKGHKHIPPVSNMYSIMYIILLSYLMNSDTPIQLYELCCPNPSARQTGCATRVW